MTLRQWNQLRYFSRFENWGDPDKMDFRLLKTLDRLRAFVGHPCIIHCGTQGQHSPNSLHYQGLAVDCHFVNVSLIDQWLAAERFSEFTGIGLYPEWQNPGLHLDIRKTNIRTRWIRIGGLYRFLDSVVLKKVLNQ